MDSNNVIARKGEVNIRQGHAFLTGHTFEHVLATADAFGFLTSIDLNRNDYQIGWNTGQFSAEQ